MPWVSESLWKGWGTRKGSEERLGLVGGKSVVVLRFLSVEGSPLMREVWGGAEALRLEGAIVDLDLWRMGVVAVDVDGKTLVLCGVEMRMVRNMDGSCGCMKKAERKQESLCLHHGNNYFL